MRTLVILALLSITFKGHVVAFSPLSRRFSQTRTRPAIATNEHQQYQKAPLPELQLYAKPKKTQDPDKSNSQQGDPALVIMPANLRRKVHAKRPALGHVVPKHLKHLTKHATADSTSSIPTSTGSSTRTTSRGGSSNPILRPQGRSILTTSATSATAAANKNPSLLKILGGSAKGRRLQSPNVYLRPMMGKVKEAVFSSFQSMGLYSKSNNNIMTTSIRHLDIFSGSGSVGLESLSRGATHCTFVDFSPDCCATAAQNMEKCFRTAATTLSLDNQNDSKTTSVANKQKTSQFVCADYLQALRDPISVGIDPTCEPFHIVTLCPPYEEVIYAELLDAIANSPLIGEDTVVLVEYPVELQTLPHAIPRRRPTYDPTMVTVAIDDKSHQDHGNDDGGGTGALIGIRNRKYGRTVIAMYVCNPSGKIPGAQSRPEEFV